MAKASAIKAVKHAKKIKRSARAESASDNELSIQDHKKKRFARDEQKTASDEKDNEEKEGEEEEKEEDDADSISSTSSVAMAKIDAQDKIKERKITLQTYTKGLADVEDQIKVAQTKTKRKMTKLMNALNSYQDDEVCAVCWPMTRCICS